MKLLIFGGSFDPPHNGHAALLTAAAARIKPDKILIVPAYQSPLKEIPSASSRQRLRMIKLGLVPQLAAQIRRKTRIDLGEINKRRRVYTIETLRRLRSPARELHFLVGSDSAESFGLWKNPQELRGLAAWWVGKRRGRRRQPEAAPRRIGQGGGDRVDAVEPEARRCPRGWSPHGFAREISGAAALAIRHGLLYVERDITCNTACSATAPAKGVDGSGRLCAPKPSFILTT